MKRGGGDHQRMRSGDVVWCNLCGGWATATARLLARPCAGRLVCKGVSGSRAHGLRALRRDRHPSTGDYIGQTCPEHAWHTVGPMLRPPVLSDDTAPAGRTVDAGRAAKRFEALRQRIVAKEVRACAAAPQTWGSGCDPPTMEGARGRHAPRRRLRSKAPHLGR